MRPENEEHALRVQLATALRERDEAAALANQNAFVGARHKDRADAAESALAAARRECDAAKDVRAYCLHMFPREWLTDPKNRNIFAAVIFKMLDEALAAPADGEEGRR